jgi:hypothetical protein
VGALSHRASPAVWALPLVLAAALTPRSAAAQQTLLRASPYASTQRFAVELKVGPYAPDVDGELGRAQPHREFFGTKTRLMLRVELDYQFFARFGTLAVGGSVGTFSESARAFIDPGPGQPPTVRSGDETELSLTPLAVSLVYRFDPAARRWGIPIVPYAKVGLDYTLWTITDGNGQVARAGASGRGRGATPGWHAALGAAFLLDVVDPGSARALDAEIGVNHTYVFAEVTKIEASGLGQRGKLHVGDTTWFAGLMFEF